MLAQTNPKLWDVAGDLIVKSIDVNGADEMAHRLRKILPPGIAKPEPGEPPPPKPAPNPETMLTMAMIKTEDRKQKKEFAKVQVELVKHKTELIKQYNATQETDTEMRKMILSVLSELHSPEHPVDGILEGVGMNPEEQVVEGEEI